MYFSKEVICPLKKESKKTKKIIFRIPLQERYLELTSFPKKIDCLHIDKVGLFVSHDGKTELTPEFIRHHLIGRRSTSCLIEAVSVEEAIKTFYLEWQGARVGGEGRKEKALWIEETIPIVALPSCDLLNKNKENEYICGQIFDNSRNGEFGMCVLQGYDAPGGCAISQFWEKYFHAKQANKLPIKKVSIDGFEYQYVTAEDIFSLESSLIQKTQ
jgi:hypothetical protein